MSSNGSGSHSGDDDDDMGPTSPRGDVDSSDEGDSAYEAGSTGDGSGGDDGEDGGDRSQFTHLLLRHLLSVYTARGGDDAGGGGRGGGGGGPAARRPVRRVDRTPEGTRSEFEIEQGRRLVSTRFGQAIRAAAHPPPPRSFVTDPATVPVLTAIEAQRPPRGTGTGSSSGNVPATATTSGAGAGTGAGAGSGAGSGAGAGVEDAGDADMDADMPAPGGPVSRRGTLRPRPHSAALTATSGGSLGVAVPLRAAGVKAAWADGDASGAGAGAGAGAVAGSDAGDASAAQRPTPTEVVTPRGPGGRACINTVRLLHAAELGAVSRLGPRRFTASAGSGPRAGGLGSVERASLGAHFIPNTLSTSAGARTLAMAGNGSRVYSGQFSASGNLFIAAWQNNQVMLFHTPSSQVGRWQPLKAVECRDVRWTVTSTDVSPDEQFVIYTSIHSNVHLCNVKGEFEIHEPLDVDPERGSGVWCAKFSSGGNELICGTSSCRLLVYDIERKRCVESVLAHNDDINSVAYADHAYRPHLIVTASDDNLLKVWDRRSMGKTQKPAGVLPGHTDGLSHVVGKGDGRYVLTNGKDQCAKLWDLRSMYSSSAFDALPDVEPRFHWDYRWMDYPGWGLPYKHPHDRSIMTYRGHRVLSTLMRCYFSPVATTGQRYVYSASQDGTIYVYDALSGETVRRLSKYGAGRQGAPVRDVSWHPHLPIITAAAFDGVVALWEYNGSRTGVAASGGRRRRARDAYDHDLYGDDGDTDGSDSGDGEEPASAATLAAALLQGADGDDDDPDWTPGGSGSD